MNTCIYKTHHRANKQNIKDKEIEIERERASTRTTRGTCNFLMGLWQVVLGSTDNLNRCYMSIATRAPCESCAKENECVLEFWPFRQGSVQPNP